MYIILRDYYEEDDSTRRFRTHNIPRLLRYLDACATTKKPIPVTILKIIYDMAIEITSWEASMRYNIDYTLLRDRVKIVVDACSQMVTELKEKGIE